MVSKQLRPDALGRCVYYWRLFVTGGDAHTDSRVSIVDEDVQLSIILSVDSLKELVNFFIFWMITLDGDATTTSSLYLNNTAHPAAYTKVPKS